MEGDLHDGIAAFDAYVASGHGLQAVLATNQMCICSSEELPHGNKRYKMLTALDVIIILHFQC